MGGEGWQEWSKTKVSARLEGKMCLTVVRPAMLYGMETVSMTKIQEAESDAALHFSVRVTKFEVTSNGHIRGTRHVVYFSLGTKLEGRD